MVKKKKDKSEKKAEERPLTEWQKQNLEFQKKKKEQALEEEKIREKLLSEKLPQNKEEGQKNLKEQVEKEKKKVKVKKKKVKKHLTIRQKQIYKSLPIFIVAIVGIVFSIFMVTPCAYQKTITVTGTNHTIEDSVLTASTIQTTDYITTLIFKHHLFEDKIKQNDPWVKDVTMSYQFPNKFTIKVTEYDVVAYSQTNQGYQPIIETGKKMETLNASELPETFLIINLSDEKQIQTLITDLSKLTAEELSEIQIVNLANSATTKDLLSIDMRDGNTIRIPLSEFNKKFPYYEKIKSGLTGEEIVDMEVGIYTTTSSVESGSTQSSATDITSSATDETEVASQEDTNTETSQ